MSWINSLKRGGYEMKKKLMAGLLLTVICIAGIPTCAEAKESARQEDVIVPAQLQTAPEPQPDPEEPETMDAEENSGIQTFSMDADQNDTYAQVEERVKEALLAGDSQVSVYDMQIPSDDNLYTVLYYSPYLSNGINASFYYGSQGYYTRIVLSNEMSVSETKSYFAEVDSKISDILTLVSENMSDEKKALVIHDYLVYEGEYDYANLIAGTLPEDSYRSGGLLMKGKGVCQAYSYAYKYLMDKLGIECYVTSSDVMNHAWNIVNIDGSYYHVDCTWDDPVYDRLGKVEHGYFLVSDDAVQEARVGSQTHQGWDLTELVCDNRQYDNAYWVNIDSQIISDGDYTYYIEGSTLYKRAEDTGNTTSLKNLGRWYVWGSSNSFWTSAYSGLFMYNDELYYNTATELRKIDLAGENDETVYVPNTSAGYVYGSKKSGNEIQYVVKQEPNEEGTVYSVTFTEDEPDSGFTDVSADDWFYEAVNYVNDQGIMTGITETEFGPDENLSRSQFAVILYRLENSPEVAYSDVFADVPDNMWFTDGILWANKNGIVTGYGDSGLFGTDDSITREQMALMMYRYAKYKAYDTSDEAELDQFADEDQISDYAREATAWAVGSGLVTGKTDTVLDPLGNASRCECSTIIMRFMHKYE